MGYNVIIVSCISAFWVVIGFILPWFVPRGPNKPVVQVSLLLTAVCAWLFWACTYLAQMNPLIGPKLAQGEILIMAKEWGNPITSG